jgi:ribosomal protein S27AE
METNGDHMPRSRKIDLEKVQASLDKTCPKCGFTITPDQVKRVDFERMEYPKCGERFRASV